VVEESFGHDCLYLAATDEAGDLQGVLPLVRVKSVLFGHFLISMPFVNYGGALGSPTAIESLAEEAKRLASHYDVDLLELRNLRQADLALDVSHRKVTVILDLPDKDPEVLWKALPAKVRSQVRRPKKEGVEVRFGSDQLDPFYAVFCRHMRDLGTPVQSKQFFRALQNAFADDVWFGCAYLGAEPVACGCGFQWGDEVEITWASALREHSRIAPNMALYWAFIERAVQERLRTFNFGRCTPGSGTHRFKLQWGGREEPLWWYQFSPGGSRAATPSPQDGGLSWGPRVWRKLPVPVATALGPRIVRYIP
jgi:FemAB-related protein (PEP-CTERM system-associated)